MSLARPASPAALAPVSETTVFWCAAAALGIVTALLYGLAPKPPFGIQLDEWKKAAFIVGGHQDFKHPILMLNLIRFANLWVGATDPAAAIDVGRVISSIAGGVTAIAAAALARRIVGPVAALCAGLLTALAPLTVFHAQIVKEDIYVAPLLLFGVLALDRMREDPRASSALAFGGVLGLAASAKYIGAILLPLALLLPLVIGGVARPLSNYYRMLAVSVAVALAVFVLVNAPLIWSPATFVQGLGYEIRHATVEGHFLHLPGWQTWFAFYLNEGLLPWPQTPFTLAGLAGAAYVIARWRAVAPAAKLLVLLGVCWYFGHELSPMKLFVGVARHMTVLAGIFAILAVYGLAALMEGLSSRLRAPALALAIALIALPATATTIAIARTGNDDTLFVLERLRPALNGPLFNDMHTTTQVIDRGWAFTDGKRDWTNFRYLIVADEVIRRFLSLDLKKGQHPIVRRFVAGYKVVSELPALQIHSTAGSYSHRNRPMRIVLLRDSPAHLDEIIARAPSAPMIEYRVSAGVPSSPAR